MPNEPVFEKGEISAIRFIFSRGTLAFVFSLVSFALLILIAILISISTMKQSEENGKILSRLSQLVENTNRVSDERGRAAVQASQSAEKAVRRIGIKTDKALAIAKEHPSFLKRQPAVPHQRTGRSSRRKESHNKVAAKNHTRSVNGHPVQYWTGYWDGKTWHGSWK